MDKAKATFEYLRKESDKLGLSLEASANGYKQIAGAARGTNLEGQKQKTFLKEFLLLPLLWGYPRSNQRVLYLSLSQMISKGKVQAEELTGSIRRTHTRCFSNCCQSNEYDTKELINSCQTDAN